MADKTVVVRAVYRSNVASGMRQDAAAVSSVSASVQSSATKSVNSMKAMGAASAIAGKLMVLGIGGAMVVSAKAAIDFESSMAGVAKTTDLTGNSFDKNSGSLYAFGEALRSVALRTPINVNDLAAIAEIGGQLGIQTPNLIDFTETMAQLGVTTNMSASEAAVGMARFANIMRTPQDEFDRLGSIVVELGNNFAATESEILKFATRIAPTMRVVGATEEEVFGLSAALTSLGIPAERGGTAVQRWMIKAKQAVDSGGESLEKFAKVAGMTSDEFATLFNESPSQAFAAFAGGLDQINKSGGDLFGTLEGLELSGVRTTQVLLAAAGGADLLTDALNRAGKEGEEVNALYEEAAKRFGTTESQIALVVNAFNDLRISIGNALLNTGGLAFGLDVIREFFGIIGDNLGTIETLVAVMGGLVAIRVGLFFAQAASSAQQAIQNFKGTATAVQTMGTATRVAQGGMLLLTGAMQGALGVAGILAAVWMTQAINAAELKRQIKALNDEIQSGTDPVEAFKNSLEEAFTDDMVSALQKAGISMNDFMQMAINAVANGDDLRVLPEVFGDMATEVDSATGKLKFTLSETEALGMAWAKGAILVDQFLGSKRNELIDSLIETGSAADMTVSEMEKLANQGIAALGFDVTGDEFVAWMKTATLTTGTFGDYLSSLNQTARDVASGIGGAMNQIGSSWVDALPSDERDNIVEGFFEDNIDAANEFVDAMDEAFQEVGNVVRGGMPVWEEYHKAVLGGGDDEPLSYQKALAAQEAFLEDTRDWIERMPDIMSMGASADTVAWIDSLETPIRGAIGRLNDAQLQELIDGANANFDELNKLHYERWMQIYPENANLAFGAMVGDLASRVGEMNLPGEQAAEAFTDGIMTIAAGLPSDNRAEFLGYVAELLNNDQWMEDNGMGQMGAWIEGILIEAGLLAKKVIPKLDNEFIKIKDHVDGQWGVASPSKWWQRLGEQFTAGLEQGISGLNTVVDFSPETIMPTMTPGLGAMSTVNSSRTSNYNLTVNSGNNQPNIRAEAQTLLTLLTIVGGVEQGAGR